MKNEDKLLNKITTFKGSPFCPMVTNRPVKMLKAFKDIPLRKKVVYSKIQINADYSKKIDGHSNNANKYEIDNSRIYWNWINFPLLAENKKDSNIKYMRYYLVADKKTDTYTSIKSSYLLDNKEVNFEDYKDMVVSSEKKPLSDSIANARLKQDTREDENATMAVFIKIPNIQSININGEIFD